MLNQQGSDGQGDGSRPAGPFASLRGLCDTLLGIAGTRFELIGIEVAEQRERLVRLLITAVAAVFALSFAALMLTFFVVVMFWDNRLLAIGACALVYGVVGAWLVVRLQAGLAANPPMFAATIAELEKDRDALRETLKRPPGVPPLP